MGAILSAMTLSLFLKSLFFQAFQSITRREGWIKVSFSSFWLLHFFSRVASVVALDFSELTDSSGQPCNLSPVVSHLILQSLFPAVAAIEGSRFFQTRVLLD